MTLDKRNWIMNREFFLTFNTFQFEFFMLV